MTRKQKKHKSPRPKPTAPEPLPPKKWWLRWAPKTVDWVWSAFLAVIAIAGGWTIVKKPVVRVDPYLELDSSSPFSERFKVSNEGYFSIYDVDATCTILDAQVGRMRFSDIYHEAKKYSRELEGGGGSTTVDCPFSNMVSAAGKQWAGVDIGFSVMYRPSWHISRAEKYVTFSGRPDSEGKIKWMY
jgi:hypothetical protein